MRANSPGGSSFNNMQPSSPGGSFSRRPLRVLLVEDDAFQIGAIAKSIFAWTLPDQPRRLLQPVISMPQRATRMIW